MNPDESSSRRSVLARIKRVLVEQGSRGTLARGAVGVFITRALRVCLLFGAQVFVARVIGVVQFGEFCYVLALVQLAAIFSHQGFVSASIRFISSYTSAGLHGLLRGYLRWTNWYVFLSSLLVSGATAAFLFGIRESLTPTLVHGLLVGCTMVPPTALLLLASSRLRGFKRVVAGDLTEGTIRPILAFMVLGLLLLVFEAPRTSAVALGSFTVAAIGTLAVSKVLVRRSTQNETRTAQPMYRKREWITTAAGLFIISISQVVLSRTDTIIIGSILGTESVGPYSAAERISILVSFALTSGNAILAPLISELHTKGDRRELQSVVSLAARLTLFGTATLFTAVAFIGPFALQAFGEGFDVAYYALLILAGGQLVNALCGPVGFLMTMTGHEKETAIILASSAGLNVALNLLLIPNWGLLGAAAATATSLSAWNIALYWRVRVLMNLRPSPF